MDGSANADRTVLQIENTECFVYCGEDPKAILIQPVNDRSSKTLDREAAAISERAGGRFLLAAFPVQDWNRDLSPWQAPAVFGEEAFGGGASETLRFIGDKLLPGLRERFGLDGSLPVILGGYSLAGLFALWSACQTDAFAAIAAASPSVWFPGWAGFAEDHGLKAGHVYLSLGDREEKTRNQTMAAVGDCIRRLHGLLEARGADCVLEWNEGNHFREPEIRSAKAFAWCLRALREEAAGIAEKSEISPETQYSFRQMTEKEREYWYGHLLPEGFEPNEIKPWEDVVRLLAEDRYEIWGLFEGPEAAETPEKTGLPIGFACLWKRPGIPLVLLDYLGVTASSRNAGLGAWMLARLREQGRPLVLESEMPVAGASEEENAIRARRIAFYERNGFHPAYEMATCGMRWQAMLAGGGAYPLEDIMRWHKELYDEKRTDVKVPLGPDEVPELPYWMKQNG